MTQDVDYWTLEQAIEFMRDLLSQSEPYYGEIAFTIQDNKIVLAKPRPTIKPPGRQRG